MGCMRTNAAYVPPSVVNAIRRDRGYFREISSPDVRRIFEALDEVLDPLEYEGSLLLDEYPDGGEVSRLTDLVLRRAGQPEAVRESEAVREQELVKALLCEEMCFRRFRHLMRRAGVPA